jgi:hypothetical protein
MYPDGTRLNDLKGATLSIELDSIDAGSLGANVSLESYVGSDDIQLDLTDGRRRVEF